MLKEPLKMEERKSSSLDLLTEEYVGYKQSSEQFQKQHYYSI